MGFRISQWKINEDADSELRYWVQALLSALRTGTVLALACGLLIAALPVGGGPASEFARDFWPWLVECAFWLGMMLGMLWGAGKRLGSALAGTLPWVDTNDERVASGRVFGHWAAFAALAGFCLWLARQIALAAGMHGMADLIANLAPLATACWLSAGIFAVVAGAGRARRLMRHSRIPPRNRS